MENIIIRVNNIKMRDLLMNKQLGEIVYCKEEDKYFIWNEGWQEFNPKEKVKGSFEIKYRDLMETGLKNMPELDSEALNRLAKELNDWANRQVYMLLNHDLKYFTVLYGDERLGDHSFFEALIECISSIGVLVYVEHYDEQNLYVLWVRDAEGNLYDLYLFDYTEGIVYFV